MDTTSLEAYVAIKPAMHAQHAAVLNILHERGQLTVSEIAAATGLYLKTTANRLSELRTSGLVVATGETRRNARNRSENVVKMA